MSSNRTRGRPRWATPRTATRGDWASWCLVMALAGAGLAGATTAAAVEVDQSGIGQVLLYPYYTVRSSTAGNEVDTLFSIGNTTDHIKAVRLRFREGAEGAPVADVNVYLGAYDMWSGAVIRDAGGGARLVSIDHSCTVPEAHFSLIFSNNAYSDEPEPSIDRTSEGFFEVIEMGDYGAAKDAKPGSVAEGVQPIGGVPFDCSRAQADTGAEAQPGTGGLFGRMILINVGDGTEFSSTATALSNFNTTRSLWAAADAPGPTLADADPPVSIVHTADLGTIRTQWAQPIDAVSAVLMRQSISNEFVVSAGIQAITDWVVTMPTKYYYVRLGVAPTRLFQSLLYLDVNGIHLIGACEIVRPEFDGLISDRESETIGPPFIMGVPPGGFYAARALCWATTVVTFSGYSMGQLSTATLFGSKNLYAKTDDFWDAAKAAPASVQTTSQSGWLTIALHATQSGFAVYGQPISLLNHSLVGGATTLFKPDGTTESRPQATYYGLPVIGFAAESYTNGTLTVNGQPVLSNYGGLIGHRYTRNVQ